MRRLNTAIHLIALLPAIVCAQSGYYISQRGVLPPLIALSPVADLAVGVNREDVRAIGMGRAQVAKGNTFMAMLYNPALLAHERFALEVPSVQASLPRETYRAVLFLEGNRSEFEEALFLTQLRDGINAFEAATTNPERFLALQKIEAGLRFPRGLLDQVVGTSKNPTTHGVLAIPSVVAQVGRWGFSVHANLQSGFKIIQSPTLEALADIEIPSDIHDEAAVTRAVTRLAEIVRTVTLPQGGFSLEDALPKAYAVSYVDIVGAVGYGMPVTPDLSVGLSLKVINRRFSTKRIAADTFDEILTEVQRDFRSSITGITADAGAVYRVPGWGTDIGISLQNFIPFKRIRSSMAGHYTATLFDYDRTPDGQFILSAKGDTAVVSYDREVTLEMPYELRLPVVLNIGARHSITPVWDVALDITDLADQDARYKRYAERIRIGTEYRLDAIDGEFGIVPRLGMSDLQLSVGLGVNLFRVLQIDAAYAHDSYVDAQSYFLQVRLGW
jgi:hypothetical protein